MARENATWGYRRVQGEFVGLGHTIGASTVWQILKDAGINPAPTCTSVTKSQVLRSQAAVARDFVTIDTALLRRLYLLFFIDTTTREVFLGGDCSTTWQGDDGPDRKLQTRLGHPCPTVATRVGSVGTDPKGVTVSGATHATRGRWPSSAVARAPAW